MFAAIRVLEAAPLAQGSRLSVLAETIAPRGEWVGADLVVLEADGLQRVWGGPDDLARAIHREAEARRLVVAVTVAPTRVAALLVVLGTSWLDVVRPETCAEVLAALPLSRVEVLVEHCAAAAAESRSPQRSAARMPGRAGHYRLAPPPVWSSAARATAARPPARARGTSPQALVPPLHALDLHEVRGHVATLRRWGLETLGELAALPLADVRARLGGVGVRLHQLARGEDDRPLVPAVAAPVFEATMTLEWPLEGVEPLSFVLGRLFDDICVRLERHDRGGIRVRVRLRLVSRAWHERQLELPAPMRDAKVLRTLVVLDLERHPPPVGIDAVTIEIDPAPGRIVQHSLLEKAVPSPEQVSTLLARLTSLMGEGRCGAPALVDSYRPGRVAMAPFAPASRTESCLEGAVLVAAVVRRFRPPVAIRVETFEGRPARVWSGRATGVSGTVRQWAGPWRGSGAWWPGTGEGGAANGGGGAWSTDEWDVELSDGGVYRVSHSALEGRWFLEGVLD